MTSILLRFIDPYDIAKRYLKGDFKIVKLTEVKRTDINTHGFTESRYVHHGLNANSKLECSWCRDLIDLPISKIIKNKKLENTPKNKYKQILGIPYQSEFNYHNLITTYKTTLFVDCYECAYALYQILALRNPGLYVSSEKMLLRMFSEDHPGKTLSPANDPWLQDKCGGPLKSNYYIKSKYISTPNRILVHTSQEYILSEP